MDVLQFDQPDLHTLDFLAQFAGKVTYWCPIDIQTTLQTGDRGVIRAKARAADGRSGHARAYPPSRTMLCLNRSTRVPKASIS